MATSCEELTHWKRPWCWEGLGAGGAGDDKGWDGWMASPTLWAWVWENSRSLWWTGRPGVLLLMGSQRVGHDWMTELNWTLHLEFIFYYFWWKLCFPDVTFRWWLEEYVYFSLLFYCSSGAQKMSPFLLSSFLLQDDLESMSKIVFMWFHLFSFLVSLLSFILWCVARQCLNYPLFLVIP